MALKLHVNDLENILYESGKNEYYIDSVGIQEINLNYQYRELKGSFREVILDNFKIGYGNFRTLEKSTLFFEFNEETVEMHFTLQGNSNTSINSLPNDIFLSQNTHNIFYCNNYKGKTEWNSKDMCFFEINLQPSFFEQYLPNEGLFKSFKKIIQNKETGYLSEHNHPISSAMLIIINEIINCSWTNKFRQLFLESKVLELLLLQLEQIGVCNLCPEKSNTSKVIIDKMYYAKEIVLSKLNNPMSLPDLAKAVGTNECTLKKEFKNVFGSTIFNYINNEKMEKAKALLMNKKLTVNEVSDISGYKNSQHFSTAFKKRYGISPSLLNK